MVGKKHARGQLLGDRRLHRKEKDGAQELRAELHRELGEHEQEPTREDARLREDRQENSSTETTADGSAPNQDCSAQDIKEESDDREQQPDLAAIEEVQIDAGKGIDGIDHLISEICPKTFDTAGRERL